MVVKIESWGVGHLNPEGRIVEVLGRAGEVSAELKSLIREFKLPLHFPVEVMREVDQLPSVIPASELPRRLDLRDELCFTIDPEDAKDFDDAVSMTELPGGDYRLGVHIADVSYYVKEGSEIDREALKRGTSVYFPNMVIPMIPERLSNVLCSLRPNEDRPTFSVLMTVTPKGIVKDTKSGKPLFTASGDSPTKRLKNYWMDRQRDRLMDASTGGCCKRCMRCRC